VTSRMPRVLLALLTLAVARTSQPRAAGQEPAPVLFERVEIGAHVYFPDARSVSTWRTFDKTGKVVTGVKEIYTMQSLCVFNSEYKQIPSTVGYGWRFEVAPVREIRGAGGDAVVVRVDWSRSRERGRTTDAPSGSVVVTLTPGKSIPLDYIVAGPVDSVSGPCSAVGMLLDISLKG
jgi:hypothetical protein